MSDIIPKLQPPTSTIKNTKPLEAKINALCKSISELRERNAASKLCHDAIINSLILDEGCLDNNLKDKIVSIFHDVSSSQCTALGNNQTVLGLPGFPTAKLTPEESDKLRRVLRSNYPHNSQIKPSDPPPTLEMPSQDVLLVERTEELNQQQDIFLENLASYLDILRQTEALKLKVVKEDYKGKLKQSKTATDLHHKQTELTGINLDMKIFSKSSNTVRAYRELIRDLKAQTEEQVRKNEELKNLLEKHSQVSCRQYNDILKSYLLVKANCEKMQLMLDAVKQH